MAWIVDSFLIVATVAVMAVYDWHLALIAVASFLPVVLLLPACSAASSPPRIGCGRAWASRCRRCRRR